VTTTIVAIGSNIPPRRQTLRDGIADLARLPRTRLLATSPLRESDPVDCPDGSGPFVNGACLLETELDAHELLAALQDIERAHGRERSVPGAPRTLDLDLVLHGGTVLDEPGLVVPHPRAHERLFVIEPAADVAPDLHHPVLGRTLAELRDELRSCAS
jgi:2-amino-4-hydroxy-6-hydroxymethyldihydropteridine diphosphokinase